ncbi:MAG: hypothetical protein ABIK65_12600 [Candidatus Eisenbacteria bacterium]
MTTKLWIVVLLLLLPACASVPHEGVPGPAGGLPPPERETSGAPTLGAESIDGSIAELLAESEADSCSICAREARERAFAIAEERFPPGALVKSEGDERFWLLPGEPNTLALGSSPPGDPVIVFRFHTAGERLIGVNPADLTPDDLAGSLLSEPPGTSLHGIIEAIPYVYGDGPTFLYQPTSGRLVVMCRIVKRWQWKPGATQ